MCVRTLIIDGLCVSALAAAMAASMASTSLPSATHLHVPAVGLEALAHVLGEGEVGGAVDGDVVVVVEQDQLAELLVAGVGGGLAADALHHAAVAGEHVGVVVDDVVAEGGGEEALGHGHADGVGDALAERAGGRLDAGGVPELGVTRRAAAPLAERLEVVHGQVVAGQVQHGVEQHARVPGGEHEAVAVRPRRVRGVVAQVTREEGVGDGSGAHRHAGMAGVGLLDAVDGEEADGLDAPLLERGIAHHCAHSDPFMRAVSLRSPEVTGGERRLRTNVRPASGRLRSTPRRTP